MTTPSRHAKFTRVAVAGTAAVGLLAMAACGAKSDPAPSNTPTPSPTQTSTKPSPTASVNVSTYKVASGGSVKVSGDSTNYTTSGGQMTINGNGGSGSGVLAAAINVAATSKTSGAPSAWTLRLVTNGSGVVTSGALISPGSEYKVTSGSGKINFLTTMNGTTVTTTQPIKVQRGTETPTTMTVNITGNK